MRESAWALEVDPKNFQAIMSEAGRSFDRPFLEEWYEENLSDPGYFVRDFYTPSVDASIQTTEEFFTLYKFDGPLICDKQNDGCAGAHFRAIAKL
jgi:hypothetical protein